MGTQQPCAATRAALGKRPKGSRCLQLVLAAECLNKRIQKDVSHFNPQCLHSSVWAVGGSWWRHVDAWKFVVSLHYQDHRPGPWSHCMGPQQHAHGLGHRVLWSVRSSQRKRCEDSMGQFCWLGFSLCVFDLLFFSICIRWRTSCDRQREKDQFASKFNGDSGFNWRQFDAELKRMRLRSNDPIVCVLP